MAAKDIARQMLAQGLQPSVVAGTIGVEESYVSQLMSDEDFAASVELMRVEQSQEDIDYDKKLERTEEGYLDKIEHRLPVANLQQSLQAFKILNGAKRRKDRSMTPGLVNHGTIVNITLPQAISPKYLTNGNNEIVEVEGQTMISATPKALDAIIAQKKPALSVDQQETVTRLQVQTAERTLLTLENVGPVRRQRKVAAMFDVDML